nr:unnamed protein product [Callosobruchus analis]
MRTLCLVISKTAIRPTSLQQIRCLPRWNHRRPVKVIASEEYDEERDTKIKQTHHEDDEQIVKNPKKINWKMPKVGTRILDEIKQTNKSIEFKIKADIKPLTVTKQKTSKKAASFDMLETTIDADGNFIYTKMQNNDPRISAILVEAKSKKEKSKKDLFVLEGKRLIKEALDAKCKLDYILFSRMNELEYIRPSLPRTGARLYKMPYKEMQLWSDLTTNPGIMGVFKIPDTESMKLPEETLPITVICDNVREGNNLGCVNVWDNKVLRTACGAHFKLQIQCKLDWPGIKDLINPNSSIFIADNQTVTTTENKDIVDAIQSVPVLPYYGVDISAAQNIVLIIGGETEGISEESYKLAAEMDGVRLNIPLSNGIDSLNTGTALGIILFEMKKQLLMAKFKDSTKIRKDTLLRSAIPAITKLQAVLYFLATGCSLRTLTHIFKLGKSTISEFIVEVCEAIYGSLREFIKIPSTADWKIIENGFRKQWNFPGCCRAIDGKHVVIKAPPDSGSLYYNYKETNSIILMTVVDYKYCFSYIDVGCNGRVSDGGVFHNCALYQELENGVLPENHVLVGDNAFPLKEYLLKPFPGNQLTSKQKIFNYRLSRARRIVENGFGILAARFRVFEKPMPYSPEKVVKIVKACCVLHIWLRHTKLQSKRYEYTVDTENHETGVIDPGSWRNDPLSLGIQPLPVSLSNRSSQRSIDRRESYADYFSDNFLLILPDVVYDHHCYKGAYQILICRHLYTNVNKFREYFRLTPALFDYVLGYIKEDLCSKPTNRVQNPLTPEQKLCLLLRFLATGESFRSLAFQFRICHSWISTIIRQVSESIVSRMLTLVMPQPTEEMFKTISSKFRSLWDFPNCIGAIDGKHVRIKAPKNRRSTFFNYKEFYSVVMLALVDADNKFVAVDIGSYGREEMQILKKEFPIPPPQPLPGMNILVPHVILGDEAFALHEHLMKPYPRNQSVTDKTKAIYNYRLSRARRTTGLAFFEYFFSRLLRIRKPRIN